MTRRSAGVTTGHPPCRAMSECSHQAESVGPFETTAIRGVGPAPTARPAATRARASSSIARSGSASPAGRGRSGTAWSSRSRTPAAYPRPRRHPHVVLEHRPPPRPVADDVEAHDRCAYRARRQPAPLGAVTGRAVDDPLGHDARPHRLARAVDVAQEALQGPAALGQPGAQHRPLVGLDDPGHEVDVVARGAAADGEVEPGLEGARVAYGDPFAQPRRPAVVEDLQHRSVRQVRGAVGPDRLVTDRRRVPREQARARRLDREPGSDGPARSAHPPDPRGGGVSVGLRLSSPAPRRAQPRGGRWQRGQVKLDRFANDVRTTAVPHRRHGRPSRP